VLVDEDHREIRSLRVQLFQHEGYEPRRLEAEKEEDDMEQGQGVATPRRLIDAVNDDKLAQVAPEVIAPGFVRHDLAERRPSDVVPRGQPSRTVRMS